GRSRTGRSRGRQRSWGRSSWSCPSGVRAAEHTVGYGRDEARTPVTQVSERRRDVDGGGRTTATGSTPDGRAGRLHLAPDTTCAALPARGREGRGNGGTDGTTWV